MRKLRSTPRLCARVEDGESRRPQKTTRAPPQASRATGSLIAFSRGKRQRAAVATGPTRLCGGGAIEDVMSSLSSSPPYSDATWTARIACLRERTNTIRCTRGSRDYAQEFGAERDPRKTHVLAPPLLSSAHPLFFNTTRPYRHLIALSLHAPTTKAVGPPDRPIGRVREHLAVCTWNRPRR